MTRSVVLVRGVNVGGQNRLAMADLRRVLAGLGAEHVQTYLQSGNAVVDLAPDGLAERVERALADDLGLSVRVLVRTGDELAAVLAGNPFPERVGDGTAVHVAFLDRTPDPELLAEVGTRHGDDELAAGDRVLYLAYAAGSHRSPLQAPLRRLGGIATARNWRTVTRLAELAR